MGSLRMLVLIMWLPLLAGCQGFPMLSDGSADWAIESVTLIEGEGEVRRDHRVVVKGTGSFGWGPCRPADRERRRQLTVVTNF